MFSQVICYGSILALITTAGCNLSENNHDTTSTSSSSLTSRYIEVDPALEGISRKDRARRLADSRTQCGSSLDFQDVESYDGTGGVTTSFVDIYERSVGYHVEPGCSGTLIAADLFLSAGHCGYKVNDTVRFGYQRNPSGTVVNGQLFSVVEIVEQQFTSTLDYAIVRLDGSPGDTFGFVDIADRVPSNNELIVIMGHPDRMPKQISTGPKVAQDSSLGANWFRHQADTLGGSSGSGVLDINGKLVGVHTNGGCLTGNPINGNQAMKMTVLIDNSPTLAELSRPQDQSISLTPAIQYILEQI